jgi:hypothetical protein
VEAHLEIAKGELQEKVQSIAVPTPGIGSSRGATLGPSDQALRHWNKRNFAVTKLLVALQTDAISAMVRDPDSSDLFRLTASDWRFEPFREQILRGGVSPVHAEKYILSSTSRPF